MKKLVILSYTILCSVLLILSYLNFSYELLENVEDGKQKVVIQKERTQTNAEFLQSLDAAMKDANLDIMYKYVEVDGHHLTYNYYMTNNTKLFIDEYEANILPNIKIYDLKQAECYDLSTGIYYVRKTQCDQTVNEIQKLGCHVTIDSTVQITGKVSVPVFATIPILLVVMSMIFYALSIGKKNMLRKMEGYTALEILKEEFLKDLPIFTLIGTLLEMLTLGVVLYQYNHALKVFLKYEMNYIFLGIAVILFGMIISYMIIQSHNKIAYIKGKVPKKGMYVISMCSTVIFIVFIVFFMTIAIRNITLYYDTFKTARFMSEKIDGYVTVPIYENSASSEGLEENYLDFYKQTVNRFQGVLIDAGNYSYDLISGTTMCEKYDQDWITVNENYLKINPIYDKKGNEIILSGNFGENVVNVLIPHTKIGEKEKFEKYIKNAYGASAKFSEYDEKKTQVYSYNAAVGNGAYGEIEAPVIVVVKEENLTGLFVLSYCSADSYFLKTVSDNPYEELKPLLEETGIIIVTPQTPYIASNYISELAQQSDMLKLYGFQSLFLMIGMVFLIVFSAILFSENYRKKIASKLIEGFSIMECIRGHMILKIFIYSFSIFVTYWIGVMTQVGMNYHIITTMFVLDMFVTIIICRKITKENLYQIVKGEE